MIIYVNNYDVGIEALPTPTIMPLLLLLLLLLLLDLQSSENGKIMEKLKLKK